MTEIDPTELSGLLDGELPAARAAVVRAAIAADPALRAAFEALARDDGTWRRQAKAARFTPAIRLPQARRLADSGVAIIGILGVLAVVRGVTGWFDIANWGLAAQAVVCCGVFFWAAHLALSADEAQANG